MKSLVVYHSQFGNTKTLAEAIAKSLGRFGQVALLPIEQAEVAHLVGIDLLVIGGPTQAHTTSAAVRAFLAKLADADLSNLHLATFDTRLRGPEVLWGSAAKSTATVLEHEGLELVIVPESFLVRGAKQPELVEGEIERAIGWAAELGTRVAAPVTV